MMKLAQLALLALAMLATLFFGNCSDGGRVTDSSGGGGSSGPDLIVESFSVSDTTLAPYQSFTLSATVRNRGTERSTSTTLRYYESSSATISTGDAAIGTNSVSGLSASGTSADSIGLTISSTATAGTIYFGACVASVSGEINTDNNCSDGVRVTVGSSSLGACSVGMVVRPNESCTVYIPRINVGSNLFVVRSDGFGCYGSICAGTGMNLNGFRASKISGTSRWRIDGLP